MKLKQEIVDRLENNLGLKKKIIAHLGVANSTMQRYLQRNEVDGDLTKLSVLNLIKEEYNLPHEQIVEV